MNYYRKAQEKGEIRKDLKIDFMIYMLNQMMAMASDEKLLALR